MKLCRLDHLLQAFDVVMEYGAVRVTIAGKTWKWEVQRDGKKTVVEC